MIAKGQTFTFRREVPFTDEASLAASVAERPDTFVHMAECYACGTETATVIYHEAGAETDTTCPACGASRTFAALRDEESGAWYAEDVTGAETDAIGYGVLTQAQE